MKYEKIIANNEIMNRLYNKSIVDGVAPQGGNVRFFDYKLFAKLFAEEMLLTETTK
jgi:hypothetical protein